MDTKPLQHDNAFLNLCEQIKQNVEQISVDELDAQLNDGESLQLIDVRDRDEYDSGHIAKAQFLSKGWIEAKIHQLTTDKATKIVLYCGGGHRSMLAADNLQKMGYSQVYSLTGGIKAWIQSGKGITII